MSCSGEVPGVQKVSLRSCKITPACTDTAPSVLSACDPARAHTYACCNCSTHTPPSFAPLIAIPHARTHANASALTRAQFCAGHCDPAQFGHYHAPARIHAHEHEIRALRIPLLAEAVPLARLAVHQLRVPRGHAERAALKRLLLARIHAHEHEIRALRIQLLAEAVPLARLAVHQLRVPRGHAERAALKRLLLARKITRPPASRC